MMIHHHGMFLRPTFFFIVLLLFSFIFGPSFNQALSLNVKSTTI